MKTPTHIAFVLNDFLRDLGLAAKMKELETLKVWDEAVGEKISHWAQPEAIKDGVILAKAADSSLLAQLQSIEKDICERLNRKMGGEVVRNISFIEGSFTVPPKKKKIPKKKSQNKPLSAAAMKKIGKHLLPIHDRELKKILKNLMIKDKQSRRWDVNAST